MKDKSTAFDLFSKLPKELQRHITTDAALYISQFIIDKATTKYPMLLNRELFCKIMSLEIVSMIRSHPLNNNIPEQKEFLDMFIKELEKAEMETGYFTEYPTKKERF